MPTDVAELKRRMAGAVSVLKGELTGLRTGRASVNLLDPIQVAAYGSSMPINQLATVSVPESRMLSVQVWDRTTVQAVDRAIREARVAVRHVRRDGLDHLKKDEKDGHMGEDEQKKLSDQIQKLTDATIAEIDQLLAVKEGEITQV